MEPKEQKIEVEKTYAYKEGKQAYFGSVPLRFNPYPILSKDYLYWEEGWFDGSYSEKAFFRKTT